MHCCGRAVKKCQGQSVASRLTVRLYSGGRPAGVGPIHIPKGHYSSGSTAAATAAAAAAIFWWGGRVDEKCKSVCVCERETRKKNCVQKPETVVDMDLAVPLLISSKI